MFMKNALVEPDCCVIHEVYCVEFMNSFLMTFFVEFIFLRFKYFQGPFYVNY